MLLFSCVILYHYRQHLKYKSCLVRNVFVRCFALRYNLRIQKLTSTLDISCESFISFFIQEIFTQQGKRRRFASGSNGAKKSHYKFIVRFFSCMFQFIFVAVPPAGTGGVLCMTPISSANSFHYGGKTLF